VGGRSDERREDLVDDRVSGDDEARAEADVLEWHPARRFSGDVFARGDDDSWDVNCVAEYVGGGRAGRRARRGNFLAIDERKRIRLNIIVAQCPADGLAEREYDVPTGPSSTAPVGEVLFSYLEELIDIHRPADPAERQRVW
jgi:hypothetical protein